MSEEETDSQENHLLVLWTTSDKEVALNMVFMYLENAMKNNWWKRITLLIWGPSAKLSSQDSEIREGLKILQDEGVDLKACKDCANRYGVSTDLEELGVEVKYMGEPLTDHLKNSSTVVTF